MSCYMCNIFNDLVQQFESNVWCLFFILFVFFKCTNANWSFFFLLTHLFLFVADFFPMIVLTGHVATQKNSLKRTISSNKIWKAGYSTHVWRASLFELIYGAIKSSLTWRVNRKALPWVKSSCCWCKKNPHHQAL